MQQGVSVQSIDPRHNDGAGITSFVKNWEDQISASVSLQSRVCRISVYLDAVGPTRAIPIGSGPAPAQRQFSAHLSVVVVRDRNRTNRQNVVNSVRRFRNRPSRNSAVSQAALLAYMSDFTQQAPDLVGVANRQGIHANRKRAIPIHRNPGRAGRARSARSSRAEREARGAASRR